MQVWLRRFSLMLALMVVSSIATVVPVEGPVAAQAPPAPTGGRPDTDGAVSVPAPVVNGRRAPAPAPEVSVTVSEDGRTVTRSDVAELRAPARAVGPADAAETEILLPEDVVRPVPPSARPDEVPGSEVTGFEPGRSTYRGSAEGGRIHSWDNPDGTITARYFENPTEVDRRSGLARESAPGLTLAPGADRFERAENEVSVSVAADVVAAVGVGGRGPGVDPLVVLEADGVTVGFDVRGQRASSGIRGEDGSVTFADLLPGVDATVSALSDGFKTDYVVESADAALGLVESLELPAGWTYTEGAGGVVVLIDADGVEQLQWGGGVAYDARGETSAAVGVELRVESVEGRRVNARVVVDEAWLRDPARQYPVTIDPYVVNRNLQQDTWVGGGITSPQGADTILRTGTEGGQYRYGLIQFDEVGSLASDPFKGLPVVSATLFMAPSYTGSCSAQTLYMRRASAAWDQNSTVWTNAPGGLDDGEPATSFTNCDNNYRAFGATKIAQYWANNPGTNFGFLFHMNPDLLT